MRSRARYLATGRPLTARHTVKLGRVLAEHGVTDPGRAHVAAACLTCGTVTTVADARDRDQYVATFDLTCCTPQRTVLLTTVTTDERK